MAVDKKQTPRFIENMICLLWKTIDHSLAGKYYFRSGIFFRNNIETPDRKLMKLSLFRKVYFTISKLQFYLIRKKNYFILICSVIHENKKKYKTFIDFSCGEKNYRLFVSAV